MQCLFRELLCAPSGVNFHWKMTEVLDCSPYQDMSRSEVDDKTKATLILCYGHVTLHASPAIVTSRLETTILKALLPHFPSVKVRFTALSLSSKLKLSGLIFFFLILFILLQLLLHYYNFLSIFYLITIITLLQLSGLTKE